MTPHALLEEIGAPFELIKLDLDSGEHRKPEYLKLNPHARIPTLIYDKGQVIYESAAITLFLLERHPELKLAPAPGDPKRALFLQWMMYLTNTVQEATSHWWHPEWFIVGEKEQTDLKTKAEQRLDQMWSLLDNHLATSGPRLCGAEIYACDYYLAMIARWTRFMAKPAITAPKIRELVSVVVARPGYRRMLEAEGIEQIV